MPGPAGKSLTTRYVNVTVDATAVLRRREATAAQLKGAAARAVRENTRGAEKALEQVTASAVGGKLWRAWASEVYEANRVPGRVVGFIFPKGGARTRGALAAQAYGANISGKRGQLLAIPLPPWREKFTERGRYATFLSPEKFVRRSGLKLRPLFRRGQPTLLVVDWRAAGRKGAAAAEVTPVFVLLPQVSLRKRFSIEATIAPLQRKLPADFSAEVRSVIAKEWGLD